MNRVGAAVAAAAIATLLVAGIASAHPLGNFTINHHAGLRIEPDRVLLDVVIDQAEIPAFQTRLGYDTDGDGSMSSSEIAAARLAGCRSLVTALHLAVADVPIALTLTGAGLSFPAGAGGLTTLRLVCEFVGALPGPIGGPTAITFIDASFPERIGWREIVLDGSGTSVSAVDGPLRATSPSARLTSYPTNLLSAPLDDRAITLRATPGGPVLAPAAFADATPLDPAGAAISPSAPSGSDPTESVRTTVDPAGAGAVPGGVTSGDVPSIFRTTDLTPLVLLVSLLSAVALGAGHALTPGHGKTLMAAYLVGTRGTARHAVGLGLSVTLSHTIGILALAGLVVGAQGILAPDVVVRTAPVVAAASIVVIGGWMLAAEIRRRRRRAIDPLAGHEVGHDHPHPHPHPHPHGQPVATGVIEAPGMHEHGGVRHSHVPAAGSTITWRSLFVLGLAGGLIPSTSALLILLGSIAAGRPAFGFVLVVAFGLGMAIVMAGIGIALVVARGRLDRFDRSSAAGRLGATVPLAASVVVLGFGLFLTAQAVAGTPVL